MFSLHDTAPSTFDDAGDQLQTLTADQAALIAGGVLPAAAWVVIAGAGLTIAVGAYIYNKVASWKPLTSVG